MEEYILQRSADTTDWRRLRRCTGRGAVRRPAPAFLAADQGRRPEGALTARTRTLHRLKDRLQELLRLRPHLEAPPRLGGPVPILLATWRRVADQVASPVIAHDELGPLRGARDLPQRQVLQDAVPLVDAAIESHLRLVQADRSAGFSRYMLKAEATAPGRISRWCKRTAYQTVHTITRPDGSATANAQEIDALLRSAWLPIFQRYGAAKCEPAWSPFKDRYRNLPQAIMLELCAELGMSDRILRPLRTMYKKLRRRFRFAGNIAGQHFASTVGILQGCPLSVTLLTVIMAVWAKAIEAETRDCSAGDVLATAPAKTDTASEVIIQKASNLIAEFTALTGTTVAVHKSSAWTARPRADFSITYQPPGAAAPTALATPAAGRHVGAHLLYHGKRTKTQSFVCKKLSNAMSFCKRAAVPRPAAIARLLAAAPMSAVLYGSEVTALPKEAVSRLRGTIADRLIPSFQRRRCLEVLLTFRRQLSRRPELRPVVADIWRARQHGARAVDGPGQRLLEAVKAAGWSWTGTTTFTPDAAAGTDPPPSIDALEIEAAEWGHAAREALRAQQHRAARRRRRMFHDDTGGIETGVNADATRALWAHRSTTPFAAR
eukprot:gene10187-3058_t